MVATTKLVLELLVLVVLLLQHLLVLGEEVPLVLILLVGVVFLSITIQHTRCVADERHSAVFRK